MSRRENSENQRRWRHARDLISVLVERDLKILYKRSSLGFGWALATPLLQLLIFTFVFRRALAVEIPNYGQFVFVGILVFGWFQSSLAQSSGLIIGSRALVTQPGFPLSLLPHVTVAVRLFHFVIAMPILAGMLLWHGVRPGWPWLALPALIGIQYLLLVGMAYPLAAVTVIFRDAQHMVSLLLQMVMFLTPVFYSLEMVPEAIRPFYYLNPMAGIVQSWRGILFQDRWPDPVLLGILAAVSVVLLLLGRRFFVRQSHRFVEEM